MSDMFYTKFVQENARNEAWKKTNSNVNTNIATTTEESFVKALSDTRLSKEELLSLSMQFEKEKTSLEESVQIRYKSLMKESLDEMLKEYTIANASDLQYLKNLIILTGAPYTTNDINLDKSPVKVRLDQKDNKIKPLHGLQGMLTSKDTSRLDVNTLLNFRNSDHVARAIDADFRRTAYVAEYLEDKLALMNGDISGGHENNGFASSEGAYRDIINFVITGGAEKRAPSGAETIHIRNKKEAQLVKSYLLDLINNDIPNARNKAPVETTTSPQVSPVTESNQTAATQTKANPIESKNSKDTLEFKAKYAEEQLKLAGETVNSLQQKLKDKKFYTGDINEKFNQATLDAVVKFQESVPNIKYGPDGLVGPVTIGILFGKKQVPANKESKNEEKLKDGEKQGPITNTIETSLGPISSVMVKDGKYYLTGPQGRPVLIKQHDILSTLNIPKNATENLTKSVGIVEDFSLILDAYIRKYPKKKSEYESALVDIKEKFSQSDIQLGKGILNINDTLIKLSKLNQTQAPASTMGYSALLQAQTTSLLKPIFAISNPAERHTAVLNFVRDTLDQSDLSAHEIMRKHEAGFKISDEDILKKDFSKLSLTPEQVKKVQDKIDDAGIEAAKNWKNNKDSYIAAFKAQNPDAKFNENDAEEWNKKLTILAMAKREVFYQKLYNVKQTDSELALLQDILGAGSWDMSDKAWDMSQEVGMMIGMEAIAIAAGVFTAGAATVAINAAVFGRNAYRGAEAISAYNKLSKVKQYSVTAGRILGSGVGFEAGAATARSQIENGDWTSMHSKEGYLQSIAMMGVMSGIGKLISAGHLGKGIQFQEGAGFAKNIVPFIGQVAIEGSAIFGTSATIGDVVFDRKDNWTLEQMAQAMIMSTIFKGAGRINFTAKKEPDGSMSVKPETEVNVASVQETTTSLSTLYSPKLGKYEYTINLTGEAPVYLRRTKDSNEEWTIMPKITPILKQKIDNGIKSATEVPSAKPSEESVIANKIEPVDAISSRVNETIFNKQVEKAFSNFHKDGDTQTFGSLTVKQEGKKFRVSGPEGEYLLSKKDALIKIKEAFKNDTKKANEFIDTVTQKHIDALPVGKSKEVVDTARNKYQIKKTADGKIEVMDAKGKILKGDELELFYARNGETILNNKMHSFLSSFGNKKISETDKVFGISTKQFFENKGKWYNPITGLKGIGNMTWNELMQPVQTWNAFLGQGGALRTGGSPLTIGNNVLKAVVLRDVNMNWVSTDAAKRVLVRGTIVTGATAAALHTTMGPNLASDFLMTPMTMAYSAVSGDTNHTYSEQNKTAFSTYYGGMIWGTLLAQSIDGMPND